VDYVEDFDEARMKIGKERVSARLELVCKIEEIFSILP